MSTITGSIVGAVAAVLFLALSAMPATASLQDEALQDRLISDVQVNGLERVSRQLVLNNIRTGPGEPFVAETVQEDVARLNRLAEFDFITADAILQPDGTVEVVFTVIEQAIINQVQVTGNTLINDQRLLEAIRITPGVARDDFLVEQAVEAIRELYRNRGHYLISIDVDESNLEQEGILVFRVNEGPRVKIKAIEFSGNDAFRDEKLRSQIQTSSAIPLLRAGAINQETLIDDVAALDRFYKQRGYLDVQVDHAVELSPDNSEAKVIFYIVEGRQYTLRAVDVRGIRSVQTRTQSELEVFSEEQIAALLHIVPGDVVSQDKLRESIEEIRDAYGQMSYLDTVVRLTQDQTLPRTRVGEEAVVDLLLEIVEGEPTLLGLPRIQGNFITQDKVIRRLLRFEPGRPLNAAEIDRAERRLQNSRLFNDVRITVQPPQPFDKRYRDVLVEVKESNTGSVNFGAAVGSDSGIFGEISIRQRNFDVADTPESLGEFIKGRAFRGAGQRFSLVIQPGNQISTFSVSLAEPHLLETDVTLSGSTFYRQRIFNRYDEERINLTLGLGRSFGDIWSAGVTGRFERVELDDIDDFAPIKIFEDRGPNTITAVGLTVTRNTTPNVIRPGRGSRLQLGVEQLGLLGGDFTFTKLDADYTVFLTLDEDFLGRKSILKLNTSASYILNGSDAPVYERYYLGGRSFRGFDFRTISPKGIRADNGQPSDDPVGGGWSFFAGAQYEFPLFGEAVNGVFFVDSGTVTNDISFEQYRVAVGTGVRLYVPAFGRAPLAFDFAFPILKEEEDETRVFSFAVQLPFN